MTEDTKQKIRDYYKNEPQEKKAERVQHIRDYHTKKREAINFYNEEMKKRAEQEERREQIREVLDLLKLKGYSIVKNPNDAENLI